MKITPKGPPDADLSQSIQNDKAVGPVRRDGESKVPENVAPAKVEISDAARELQYIANLARTGDELRADKLAVINQQITAGLYQAEAREVAKSILRSEVARLLDNEQGE